MRIGFAKDIHKFSNSGICKLGGIIVSKEFGFIAHSDGDVVFHALSESILGALALGDLGKHFPVEGKEYDNIDSEIILRKTLKLMMERNYRINNIDISIELDKFKLSTFIEDIRNNLARILEIDIDLISVKAMSNEGLDSIGQGLACACYSNVLLEEIK